MILVSCTLGLMPLIINHLKIKIHFFLSCVRVLQVRYFYSEERRPLPLYTYGHLAVSALPIGQTTFSALATPLFIILISISFFIVCCWHFIPPMFRPGHVL